MAQVAQETTSQNTRQDLEKDQRLEALRKRIRYLEFILAEKGRKFISRYNEKKPFFQGQKNMVLRIFFVDPLRGLKYRDILEEWKARDPSAPTKNLPRRIRELVNQGFLWSDYNEIGEAIFYLKLSRLVSNEEAKVSQLKLGDDNTK